uniref:Uncharacterized protein n=1 Tax=Anguilla anguilla TaxID=7936 RepID=A0A0E9VWS7_ANGAN
MSDTSGKPELLSIVMDMDIYALGYFSLDLLDENGRIDKSYQI